MNIKLIILLILMCFEITFATFQEGDILIYRGDTLRISIFPLEDSDIIPGHNFLPDSGYFRTNNQRGYVATWLIEDNKLFLVNIKAWETKLASKTIYEGDSISTIEMYKLLEKVTVSSLFSSVHQNNIVEANWYSGTIIPGGSKWGNGSNKKEEERLLGNSKLKLRLTIKNGKVITIIDDRIKRDNK